MTRWKERPLRREAAALRFDTERDDAPRVVAIGRGLAAERIVDTARGSGVPVHMDPELAHTLNEIGLGREIPPELYAVVAQILLFVCDMDRSLGVREPRARPGDIR
ncbi:MAG: EscU/YscU/HrcU family type III secretion system export apparatus switch protein [Oscillospiraceae bacterium]|jgi:flagellar biosynthesis protein|nr:EscU/YscU/HrcU family type III secretion system export apparatus switch protein [Oscillospiraceae bacterium]